jgi:hypothetical protein
MAFTFNTQEQAAIEAARLLSPAGNLQGDVTGDGNWVPFYTTLSNILGQHIGAGDVSGTDLINFKNVKLWLDVAIGANGGTGNPPGTTRIERRSPFRNRMRLATKLGINQPIQFSSSLFQ